MGISITDSLKCASHFILSHLIFIILCTKTFMDFSPSSAPNVDPRIGYLKDAWYAGSEVLVENKIRETES